MINKILLHYRAQSLCPLGRIECGNLSWTSNWLYFVSKSSYRSTLKWRIDCFTLFLTDSLLAKPECCWVPLSMRSSQLMSTYQAASLSLSHQVGQLASHWQCSLRSAAIMCNLLKWGQMRVDAGLWTCGSVHFQRDSCVIPLMLLCRIRGL